MNILMPNVIQLTSFFPSRLEIVFASFGLVGLYVSGTELSKITLAFNACYVCQSFTWMIVLRDILIKYFTGMSSFKFLICCCKCYLLLVIFQFLWAHFLFALNLFSV